MATPLYPTTQAMVNYNRQRWIDWEYTLDNQYQGQMYGSTCQLSTSRGSGVQSWSTPTFADYYGGGSATYLGFRYSNNPVCFISPPVSSDVTISGTITFNVWAYESSMSANVALVASVYKVDYLGVATLIVTQEYATELGTSNAARQWTASGYSNQTLHKGDRLMLVLGHMSYAASMASGYTMYGYWNGSSAGASGDTYVSFTETISFMSSPSPSGTEVFMTDIDSDVTGPVLDTTCKEMWKDRGNGVQTKIIRNMSLGGLMSGADPRYDRVTESDIDTEGPLYPHVGENIYDSAGSSWSNPSAICANDGSYASNYITVGGQGYTLRGRDFQFQNVVGRIMTVVWGIKGYTAQDLPSYDDQDAALYMTDTNYGFRFTLSPAEYNANINGLDYYGDYWGHGPWRPDLSPGDVKSATTWKMDWINDSNFQTQTYYCDYFRSTVDYAKYVDWFTPPLVGFTLSDWVRVVVRATEDTITAASNILTLGAEIAVVDYDGNEVAVYGRTAGTTTIAKTTENAVTIDIIGPDIVVEDCQRIRIRVGMANYQSTYGINSYYGHDHRVYYNGDTDGASGDASIVFTQTLNRCIKEIGSIYFDMEASGTDTYEAGGITDSGSISEILTVATSDIGADIESATVYVDLTVATDEVFEHIGEHVDSATARVTVTPSFAELAETQESATVYNVMTPSAVEIADFVDSVTIPLGLLTTGTDEYIEFGIEWTDSATVTIAITGIGGECFSTWSGLFLTEGEAYPRWNPGYYLDRWSTDDETRWSVVAITSLRGC